MRRAALTRGLVQIPHPDLQSPNPTRFLIRTFDPIPSMAHTLAIVRAVEKKLGPVLDIYVPKDADTLQPNRIMTVSTLRPVEWKDDIVMEIPSPSVSNQRFGGVSLSDVTGALEGKTEDKSRPLRVRIEVAKKAPREKREEVRRRAGGAERAEDDAIVRALEKFGGGFFGGMEGVAGKFGGLKVEKVREEAVVVPLQKPKLVDMEVIEPASAEIVEEVKKGEEAAGPEAVAEEVTEKVGEVVEEVVVAVKSRAEKLAEKALQAAMVNAKMEEQAAAERRAVEEAVKAEEEVGGKAEEGAGAARERRFGEKAADEQTSEGGKSSWGWFGKK